MNLPPTIEILDRTYEIIPSDTSDSDSLCSSSSTRGTITIDENIDSQLTASLLLGEILEIADDNAKSLVTVIRDNPTFFHTLIDSLERDDLNEEEEEDDE